MLPVFVYGTLRPGSWNHDEWLAPWLAAPCRADAVRRHRLHHLDGLPYVVASGCDDDVVVGDLADLDGRRAREALAALDRLEDVEGGHYVRVEVVTTGRERAWMWVAGPLVRHRLVPSSVVGHGDWLARSEPRR